MMRNFFVTLPLFALAACGAANSESRDQGPDGTRSFTATGFEAVSLEGSDNVRVIRGPSISVTATGPQRVLDLLNIRVENNTLKIDRKSGRTNWLRSDYRGATITVTMPVITAAAVAGSGDMTVDRADGPAFIAAVEGSGNLKVAAISVKRAALSANGSGDLTVAGTATDATMAAEGSGNVDARGLVSQQATIAVEGSGNVEVTGTDNCAIVKNGSGEARCTR